MEVWEPVRSKSSPGGPPAKKGFFVLHYGAPEDIAGEYHGVFEKVTASFQPHLP